MTSALRAVEIDIGCSLSRTMLQRMRPGRDVVQRGLNGQKRVGEAALARRGSIAQSLQLFQRNHVLLAEWSDQGPPQRADMAVAAEQPAKIARQRPHIGSLAALGLEHGMVAI